MRIPPLLLVSVLAVAPGYGAPGSSKQDLEFFESTVRPILRKNCLACHNSQNKSSGLAVDTRSGILAGGTRGAAAKEGAATESLLIQAIEQTGDLKMPPGGKLKDEQIAVLKRWIDTGLPWPEAKTARPGADHWSFQPVRHPDPPAVKNDAWVRNPIDRFVLARIEKAGVSPSPEAERRTLIRRLSLDLTGLPPSPEEVKAFLEDDRPDAYEQVADRLLASPHYGERWGRHWLDIARYADSDGYTIDAPRDMWPYRDWVIRALNSDMPFDRFVIEQYAGDLLLNPTVDQLVATGFHRNTPSNYEGGIDFEQYRVEAVVDRVATTGAAFLGLTVGCARCHDHKYDPVSQREFYQLLAFMNNTGEIDTEADRYDFNRPMLELPTPEESARRAAWQAQFSALSRELATYVRALSRQAGLHTTKDYGLQERMSNLRQLRRREPKLTTTLIMRERATSREAYIHLGGDFTRHGDPVQPGVPAVLPALHRDPGASGPPTRLDLARWLVSKENPLTPRVTMNRIWQSYFGGGLVATEDDFGTQGDSPTHPELLDWLASEFMDHGWSMKAMHRLIVTSATYRQSSKLRPELEHDPDNRLIARQVRMRLDAEVLRDSALRASGLLNPTVGGPSVYPPIPDGAMAVTQVKREWPTATGPDRYRRGMYTFFWRSAPHPGLVVFDAPDATSACTRRARSNTPLQALTLLNDEAFIEFAQALAARVWKEEPSEADARLNRAFEHALGRPPLKIELDRLKQFLANQTDEFRTNATAAAELAPKELPANVDAPRMAAWTAVGRVLFNLDDFQTRE